MQYATNRAALLAALPLAAIFAVAGSGRAFADANPAPSGDDVELTDDIINTHRDRQDEILAQSRAIMAKVDAANRDPTDDEGRELDELKAEFDNLEKQIERRVDLLARERRVNERNATPRGRRTSASAEPTAALEEGGEPQRPRAQVIGPVPARSGMYGFRHAGEYFNAVARAALSRNSDVDARLMAAAASTIATEGAGPDGGFAVPPDMRSTIMEAVMAEDDLLGRCDVQDSSSNTLTLPTDMTTQWGTDGIQAYWEGETDAIRQSKPALQNVTLRLHKLAALVPISEELLEDAPAMGSYVNRKAPEKIRFKVSHAIAWGNGVGMPLGFMNSPALVTQAAEGSQTADTINATNVVKMLSRLPAQCRKTAVWLCHPDAEPQFPLMTIGNQPVYLPPGGLRDSPYGALLGRPVIPHEVCETVGDVGDLMLVDLKSYLAAKKAGGIKASTSLHLWFDQDLMAFKFTFRLAGQPWWSAAISPRDGANTRSPFVTLAAR